MKESLARIHIHELEAPEIKAPVPAAANDNNELPPLQFQAANDNAPIEKEQLAAIQERLGVARNEPVETVQETPEEIPVLPSEEAKQSIKRANIEMMPGYASIENHEIPVKAAQAAGGAEQKESSSDGSGKGGGRKGGLVYETSSIRHTNRAATWFKRLLKAPLYLFGAAFALFMTAVIKSTNKIFDSAKLTKGGGSKNSGGGSKPSGGGGHGGSGHH